jgi:hypothetical protein
MELMSVEQVAALPTQPDGSYQKYKGGTTVIWWKGKPWRVPPVDPIKDYGAAEEYLRGKRKNPLDAIIPSLEGKPDFVVREMLDRAYRDMRKGDEEAKLPRHEVADWLDTQEGFFWTMQRALAKDYPSVTADDVKEMFKTLSLAEALKIRDDASEHLLDPIIAAHAEMKKGE